MRCIDYIIKSTVLSQPVLLLAVELILGYRRYKNLYTDPRVAQCLRKYARGNPHGEDFVFTLTEKEKENLKRWCIASDNKDSWRYGSNSWFEDVYGVVGACAVKFLSGDQACLADIWDFNAMEPHRVESQRKTWNKYYKMPKYSKILSQGDFETFKLTFSLSFRRIFNFGVPVKLGRCYSKYDTVFSPFIYFLFAYLFSKFKYNYINLENFLSILNSDHQFKTISLPIDLK